MENEESIARNELSIAERRLALEKCEAHLHASGRRAIEEVVKAGNELYTIKSQELWRARPEYDGWVDYVEGHLGYSIDLVTRWMHVYDVAHRLQGTGLMLPENESQAIELAKAPETRLVPIWQQLVSKLQEVDQGLTVDLIKRAIVVDGRERGKEEKPPPSQAPPPSPGGGKGVTVNFSDDEEKPVARFSEAGEAALDKIKTVCGKAVVQAIYDGRLKVPQRDLIEWAEQDDQLIRNLAYYIVELRWSLKKAMSYEDQLIDSETTVNNLVTLTRARGGRFAYTWEQNKITVDTKK